VPEHHQVPSSEIARHARLVLAATRVSVASVSWSFLIGGTSVAAGISSHSVALVGFGLESFIDAIASVVLVWRFRVQLSDPVRADRVERAAERAVAITLLMVSVFLIAESAHALFTRTHAEATLIGTALTVASLVVLPLLATIKLRVARLLPSPALRGDGVLTAAGTALAAAVLLAFGLDRAFGWWWFDSIAALTIAAVLAWDARRTLIQWNA
jgi:divalent metal cation (Fe/Co/Zn/Cd) transporter